MSYYSFAVHQTARGCRAGCSDDRTYWDGSALSAAAAADGWQSINIWINRMQMRSPVVKVFLWSRGLRGAHLTKPGWSKPHTHSKPTNLALFRHKITLYRFNQGGSYYCRGGAQMGAGGLSPPSPAHFNHWRSLSSCSTQHPTPYRRLSRADFSDCLHIKREWKKKKKVEIEIKILGLLCGILSWLNCQLSNAR